MLPITLGPVEIMNNSPWHFIFAGIVLALFLVAVFSKNNELKAKLQKVMYVFFGLAVIAGIYIWTIVDFSLPLLVKSVGGFVLFWTMLQLIKNPKSKIFWGLFVAIAAVGLSFAFLLI